jgi:hypothetical protein
MRITGAYVFRHAVSSRGKYRAVLSYKGRGTEIYKLFNIAQLLKYANQAAATNFQQARAMAQSSWARMTRMRTAELAAERS